MCILTSTLVGNGIVIGWPTTPCKPLGHFLAISMPPYFDQTKIKITFQGQISQKLHFSGNKIPYFPTLCMFNETFVIYSAYQTNNYILRKYETWKIKSCLQSLKANKIVPNQKQKPCQCCNKSIFLVAQPYRFVCICVYYFWACY